MSPSKIAHKVNAIKKVSNDYLHIVFWKGFSDN